MTTRTSDTPDPPPRSPTPGPHGGDWARPGEALVGVLHHHSVAVDTVDPATCRFQAVPVGEDFNKQRSNLLLHCPHGRTGGALAFVDMDLVYEGARPEMARAMTGSCARNWRRLVIPPAKGPVGRVLGEVLDLLESPMCEDVQAVLPDAADEGEDAGPPADGGLEAMMAAVGEELDPPTALAAFKNSCHGDLARQLALVAARAQPPNSAVVWGAAGVGKDTLLLAAAGAMFESGLAESAVRIHAARIAVGALFPAEADLALQRLLTEAEQKAGCVLLVHDLDVALTGSAVCMSLLCGAMDRGVRMLASVRTPLAAARLAGDDGLVRRLIGVGVPEPASERTNALLADAARASGVEVHPAALHAVRRLARDLSDAGAEPGKSLRLLHAALAQASAAGGHVDPDVVCSIQPSRWPENPQWKE